MIITLLIFETRYADNDRDYFPQNVTFLPTSFQTFFSQTRADEKPLEEGGMVINPLQYQREISSPSGDQRHRAERPYKRTYALNCT